MITEALVTVGGKGSRLREAGIQFSCTKSFIEVLGEPLIFWNLQTFRRLGLRRIVFCADSEQAIAGVKECVTRVGATSADYSFLLDRGLGTAGLPFHFRRQFNGMFFFITGHSFVTADHFNAMREAAAGGTVTVSTYREQDAAKNIRTDSLGTGSGPGHASLPFTRMIDYPYVIDRTYCERIALNDFDVLSTLKHFHRTGSVNLVDNNMPVEIDEPEQFVINIEAIERSILETMLL